MAILLIVVAVVAGASVYLYVNHTAQANMLGGDMMVGYHSLTLTGGQTAYLQITVQDTGTISLENIQVYLAGAPLSGPGVQCSGIPQSLSPGESAAITCVITSFTDCTGNAYGPAYIAPITKTQMQTWTVAEGHGRVIPFPPCQCGGGSSTTSTTTTSTNTCTTIQASMVESGDEFPLYVTATTSNGGSVSSPVVSVVAQE